MILNSNSEETLRQLIYETASKTSKLTPSVSNFSKICIFSNKQCCSFMVNAMRLWICFPFIHIVVFILFQESKKCIKWSIGCKWWSLDFNPFDSFFFLITFGSPLMWFEIHMHCSISFHSILSQTVQNIQEFYYFPGSTGRVLFCRFFNRIQKLVWR